MSCNCEFCRSEAAGIKTSKDCEPTTAETESIAQIAKLFPRLEEGFPVKAGLIPDPTDKSVLIVLRFNPLGKELGVVHSTLSRSIASLLREMVEGTEHINPN